MKMTHRGCGGIVIESNEPPYKSDEYGTVPVYRCFQCQTEIMGDSQIQFIPENRADEIQIGAMEEIAEREMKMKQPTSCINCHEDIDPLDRPKFLQKLWNAYFLCDDCGRMARISVIITAVVMALLGWFF